MLQAAEPSGQYGVNTLPTGAAKARNAAPKLLARPHRFPLSLSHTIERDRQNAEGGQPIKYSIFLAILIAAAMTACSSDDVVIVEENLPPVMTFAFEKRVVEADTPVQLNVAVDDPDGDPVTVNWTIQRGGQDSGLILGGQGTPVLNWRAPVALATDMITITATDGNGGSTTIVETIRNGTVRVSPPAIFLKASSPYIIRPAGVVFAIPGNLDVIVEPGVELFMDKVGTIISVQGSLTAIGTVTDSITFTSNIRNLAPGKWVGIQVVGQPTFPVVTMDYCRLEYGIDCVQASFDATVTIQHSLLRFNMFSAIKVTGGTSAPATLTLTDSDLRDNSQRAVNIETPIGVPGTIRILRNKFTFNGLQTPRDQGAPVNGAIHMKVNDPLKTGTFNIIGNNIFRNFNVGIFLEVAVFPLIRDNALVGNDWLSTDGISRNIRLQPPFGTMPPAPALDVTAKNNYWFAATLGDIQTTIVDSGDSGQITAEVLVDPCLFSCPDVIFPFDEDVCP